MKVNEGDLLLSDTWGGGGCGDPFEREIEKVVFDVQAGLVTPQGARNYGVVINSDLTADVAATTKLRAKLAAERGPVPLFDRGFTSIESLKARCKAETGHEAPQQPRFSERVLKSAGVGKKKTKAA